MAAGVTSGQVDDDLPIPDRLAARVLSYTKLAKPCGPDVSQPMGGGGHSAYMLAAAALLTVDGSINCSWAVAIHS